MVGAIGYESGVRYPLLPCRVLGKREEDAEPIEPRRRARRSETREMVVMGGAIKVVPD
jgi:hypothetical protein